MGGKVRLSDGARLERAKLPERVRDQLDETLDRLARDQRGHSGGIKGDILDSCHRLSAGESPDHALERTRFALTICDHITVLLGAPAR